MPANPFTDVWHFLTATTNDYLHQGNWRYLILALFWALLFASIAVAVRNWREDPSQRSGRHLDLAGPSPGWNHVVPGHVVEAAAARV